MKIQISTLCLNKWLVLFLLVPFSGANAASSSAAVADEDLAKKARAELGAFPSSPPSAQTAAPTQENQKPFELVSTALDADMAPDYGPDRQLYLGVFPAYLRGSGTVSSTEKFSYAKIGDRPGLSLSGGYWMARLGNGRVGLLSQITFATYGFLLSASGRANSGEMRLNTTTLSVGPAWENYFASSFSVVLSSYLGQLFVSQLGKTDALSNSQTLTFAGLMLSPQWHLSKRWQVGSFLQWNREISAKDDLQVQRLVYGLQLGYRF